MHERLTHAGTTGEGGAASRSGCSRGGGPAVATPLSHNSRYVTYTHEDPLFPPTTVNLRIYWDGVVVHSATATLDSPVLWPAAEIHFENGQIRIVGLDVPM